MEYRLLGKTGLKVSEISLGTWQVGGRWGAAFDHKLAEDILHEAADNGVNFIDTADVYGDGESEKAVGRFVRSRKERIYVATKCGRQLNPHVDEAYQPAVLRKFVENSLLNMGLETLDLIQLHCPPTAVYYRPEIFELFDRLREEGKIQHLGISVEKVEEALKGIEYDNVSTVQIIFNMFRQRPSGLFFEQAANRNVGVIVRVPLASGLLTGKFTSSSVFAEGDHRFFNRNGEQFDKGETFSGIDYETGLSALEALKEIFGKDAPLASIALRWILMFSGVSCIIPGASSPVQVKANLEAAAHRPLSDEEMGAVKEVYRTYFGNTVHHWW